MANLGKIPYPLLKIKARDKFPADILPDIIKSFQACIQSKTGSLALNVRIKKDALIMLTSNLDIADRLINGQLGTVFDFQYSKGTITKMYATFNDFSAGIIKRDSDNFAKVNGVIPLERTELDLNLSKSSTIFVKRTQFQIRLAWACTIHKVQGLVIPNLAISLQLDKQTAFGASQKF